MKLNKTEFTNLRYLHDKYESEKDKLVEVLCNKLIKSYENISDDLKGYGTALDEIHEKAKEYLNGSRGLKDLFGIRFPKDSNLITLTFIHTTDKGYQWPIGYTFKLDD